MQPILKLEDVSNNVKDFFFNQNGSFQDHLNQLHKL